MTPKSPRVDVLAKSFGRGEPRAETLLERVEDVGVDVEPGHVRDRERPEEWKPEAERRTHHLVDLLGGGDALLDDPRRLPEHGELDAVGDEARAVADDDGGLAEPRERSTTFSTTSSSVDAVADDLDAGNEKRRHEPVHAQEPLRSSQPRRQLSDRDRRRVRRDHRIVSAAIASISA